MLRALLYGLAILHLGPSLAFAVLAFGGDPSQQLLGAVCQGDTFGTFVSLTLIFWLALGVGAVAPADLRRREAQGAAVQSGPTGGERRSGQGLTRRS